jgi:formate hydrogenlyase transcriptional activator
MVHPHIEALENKIKEREILLSISNAIANVKDRNGLLEVINTKCKQLFYFTHSTVLQLSNDQQFMTAFLLDPNSLSKSDPDYYQIVLKNLPVNDGIINTVLGSDDPVLFNIIRQVKVPGAPDYIKMNYKAGLKELLAIVFRKADQLPSGIIMFYTDREGSFPAGTLSFLQGVGYHISTAMENILNHEDGLRRHNENQILLEFSNQMIAIKEKEDLLHIVNHTLRKYIPYDDNNLLIYHKERKVYTVYAYDMLPQRAQYSFFQTMIEAEYPDVNHQRASFVPEVTDVADLARAGIFWGQRVFEIGIREIVHLKLIDGDETLGQLVLMSGTTHFFSKAHLSLLEAIAYHLSKALANILAKDEIRLRENERAALVTFSTEIASARDKHSLSKVITRQLKNLRLIKDYVICIVNDDRKTHSNFLFDIDSPYASNPAFAELARTKIDITDGIWDLTLNATEPQAFDVEELMNRRTVPEYVYFWDAIGFKKVIGSSLRYGSELLGILWIQPEQVNNYLLKGVSSQIAIAIANIMAKEKIEQQLAEISGYKQQLEEEKLYLQQEVSSGYSFTDIIGSGLEMKKVFNLLEKVAFANSTVLLLGESGTGKELIARAIHNSSSRKDKLMVKVNCAALPASLIESELFGHERGSFTGATERRLGKFELANHGTLFLDEIGEMPLDLQVKLLRVLQEKEIERIGGKTTIKIDVRIIAATNRNLQKEVDHGRFRMDLFYRLNVFPITLPPLREHREDIPELALHFMEKYAKNIGKKIYNISSNVMKDLMAYNWPGNVRELEHLIERSILMTTGSMIKEIYLPLSKGEEPSGQLKNISLKTHKENEREHIIAVLNKCNGKIFGPGGAAEILNLKVATLNSKIKRLGIKKEKSFFKTE